MEGTLISEKILNRFKQAFTLQLFGKQGTTQTPKA
jgi:hypothetical protein